MSKFHIKKSVDKNGPRFLGILELEESETKLLILSRQQGILTWEKTVRFNSTYKDEALADDLRRHAQNLEYISVVAELPKCLVRLLTLPGRPGNQEALTQQVQQTLGVDEANQITYAVGTETRQGDTQNFTVVASVMPAEVVKVMQQRISEAGLIPTSLIAGTVAWANLINASTDFLKNDEPQAFFYVARDTSNLLIFKGQDLMFIRQFNLGFNSLIKEISSKMQLDFSTAEMLYSSGAVDVSEQIGGAVKNWLHQTAISLDFFARRYGQVVNNVNLCGIGAGKGFFEAYAKSQLNREVTYWNSFKKLNWCKMGEESAFEVTPGELLLAFSEGQRIMRRNFTDAV